MTPTHWRKSTRSGVQTNCVEVPRTLDAVRDSKRPEGAVLSARGLPALIRLIKAGDFDR